MREELGQVSTTYSIERGELVGGAGVSCNLFAEEKEVEGVVNRFIELVIRRVDPR